MIAYSQERNLANQQTINPKREDEGLTNKRKKIMLHQRLAQHHLLLKAHMR